MANQAYSWDEEGGEQDEDEWCCPGGDIVGADGEVRVRLVCLDGLRAEEEENPDAIIISLGLIHRRICSVPSSLDCRVAS